ncbi:hypothetical protein Cgig2_007938 [Carnegiea gigantea]|uniref:Sigma factor n=1 Tax=Carnegiea gigantea TaxID=171969 RepID=A0A9Q1KEN0_9CARY|nr:hypothetical protein Cgig2_007938 [Carnegiea gigantea]
MRGSNKANNSLHQANLQHLCSVKASVATVGGMGVATVPSSASQTCLGLGRRLSANQSTLKKLSILGFKADKKKTTTLVAAGEPVQLGLKARKDNQKKPRSVTKRPKEVCATNTAEICPYAVELDVNEAAAKLENIYRLSPATDDLDLEDFDSLVPKSHGRWRKNAEVDEKKEESSSTGKVVRNRARKVRRLSLNERIQLNKSEEEEVPSLTRKKTAVNREDEKIEELVREYYASPEGVSVDWKKTKMPPVLSPSEHAWLFKLMEPMKAISYCHFFFSQVQTLLQVRQNLQLELGRDPRDAELGTATNMTAGQARRHMRIGHAARNKLIKHNLRLVLFGMNKYFQDFTNGPWFQDLCQAGVQGLMTAIDRFEPTRSFRLSTYALFWIKHAIIRSMTVSSFLHVSFGLESVRMEIQKAKLQLMFELKRMPTDKEITERVGISPGRYQDVMRTSNPVLSLHSRNPVTQREFIGEISDIDGIWGDNWRRPALLRLALDDVLDSLKPKESLVIRQRYGLDGKGERTLGEISGNLNISREMVRKYEMKALLKLKHPARVDYLRPHL